MLTPKRGECRRTRHKPSVVYVAFALFYSVMGLPFGRAADRYSRRNLIIAGVLSWSAMTALCTVARSFAGLFVARISVGVGEATLSPAGTSMIADSVPRHRLATALGVYHMGISIGGGLALLVGGVIVQAVASRPFIDLPLLGPIASWRMVFLIVGLPGVALALRMLAVKEPPRRNQWVDEAARVVHVSLREALLQMRLRLRSVLGSVAAWHSSPRPISPICFGRRACSSACIIPIGTLLTVRPVGIRMPETAKGMTDGWESSLRRLAEILGGVEH